MKEQFTPQPSPIKEEMKTREKKHRRPNGFWAKIPPEVFIEELKKTGINIHHPPAIRNLPQHLSSAIYRNDNLKQEWYRIRQIAGKNVETHAPRNSRHDLEFLVNGLNKEGIHIEDLLAGTISIRSLGSKWGKRINGYGGKMQFLQDCANQFHKAIDQKIRKPPNYYDKLSTKQWKDEFRNLGMNADQISWTQIGRMAPAIGHYRLAPQ